MILLGTQTSRSSMLPELISNGVCSHRTTCADWAAFDMLARQSPHSNRCSPCNRPFDLCMPLAGRATMAVTGVRRGRPHSASLRMFLSVGFALSPLAPAEVTRIAISTPGELLADSSQVRWSARRTRSPHSRAWLSRQRLLGQARSASRLRAEVSRDPPPGHVVRTGRSIVRSHSGFAPHLPPRWRERPSFSIHIRWVTLRAWPLVRPRTTCPISMSLSTTSAAKWWQLRPVYSGARAPLRHSRPLVCGSSIRVITCVWPRRRPSASSSSIGRSPRLGASSSRTAGLLLPCSGVVRRGSAIAAVASSVFLPRSRSGTRATDRRGGVRCGDLGCRAASTIAASRASGSGDAWRSVLIRAARAAPHGPPPLPPPPRVGRALLILP